MNSFTIIFVLQLVVACTLACGGCGGIQKGACKSADLCCFPSRSEYYVNQCGVGKENGPYYNGGYGYGGIYGGYGPWADNYGYGGYGYGGCGCGSYGYGYPYGGYGYNSGYGYPYGGYGYGSYGGYGYPYGGYGYGGYGYGNGGCGCGSYGYGYPYGGYGEGYYGGYGYGPYDTYSYGGYAPFDASPFYPTQCGPERVIVENDKIICQPCVPKCNCAKKPIPPC